MNSQENIFLLTRDDKLKYLDQIYKFDLSLKKRIMEKVPLKLNLLLQNKSLNSIQLQLINDVVELYRIIKDNPQISEEVQKKILFAMNYFSDEEDEIPDAIPVFGLLDDAAVISWIVSDLKGSLDKKVRS